MFENKKNLLNTIDFLTSENNDLKCQIKKLECEVKCLKISLTEKENELKHLNESTKIPSDNTSTIKEKNSPAKRRNAPSQTTQTLQVLNNSIYEIIKTGELTDSNILDLRYWMDENRHLSGNYPYDKIYSMIDDILSDGVIEDDERMQLLEFFKNEKIKDSIPEPVDTLKSRRICLTGDFNFMSRKEIEKCIIAHGGVLGERVTQNTYYVFVGGCGSNAWAFGNYGTKIKKAKELKEQGYNIHILGEDALENFFKNNP